METPLLLCRSVTFRSVVVSSLQEVDASLPDPVNDPMLTRQAPRPYPGCQIFEGFRLTDPLKWIAHYILHDPQQP